MAFLLLRDPGTERVWWSVVQEESECLIIKRWTWNLTVSVWCSYSSHFLICWGPHLLYPTGLIPSFYLVSRCKSRDTKVMVAVHAFFLVQFSDYMLYRLQAIKFRTFNPIINKYIVVFIYSVIAFLLYIFIVNTLTCSWVVPPRPLFEKYRRQGRIGTSLMSVSKSNNKLNHLDSYLGSPDSLLYPFFHEWGRYNL